MEILSIVKKLQQQRADKNIEPVHVPEMEIIKEVSAECKNALMELSKTGKLSREQTISSFAYKIKEE